MRKLLLIAGCLAIAASQAFAWEMTGYHTQMDVKPDGSVAVTETLKVDFTGDFYRHGIYRDIPLTGSDSWGNRYRIRLSDLKVMDGGIPAETKVTRQSGNFHIRIGDPDSYVQGQHAYVISYKLLRAVHYFKDHDEVYWNVIGDKWEVPIPFATATVTLPSDVPADKLKAASYTGSYGSTSSDAEISSVSSNTVKFKMRRALNSYEGMTVVVGWPKGIVGQPSLGQEILWFVSDNGWAFLPFLFLLLLLILWEKAGRDPVTGRSETVVYDPPDNMNPAEIGALIDERVDIRDISASIIDLAVRGYIKIRPEVQDGILFSRTDYELTLQKTQEEIQQDQSLTYYEKKLIDAIFGGLPAQYISGLKYKFYSHLPTLQGCLYDSMVKRGYFSQRPDSVRAGYTGLGIGILIAGIALAIFLGSGAGPILIPMGWGISIALCGVFMIAAARVMPKKTAKGKDALLGVKGFEEYLARAERGQIEFQERQGYFDKFLPYAMAFGIADKWARAFDGIQTTPPSWYASTGGDFRPSLFAYNMMAASNSWGSAMTSQPRSSGSGGSSFFGGGSGFSGGFSGGGGGGGGGGAW